MRNWKLWPCVGILAAAGAVGLAAHSRARMPHDATVLPDPPASRVAAPTAQSSDLVVHEWGTFLAMSDANGVTLDAMYHEEHALPSFVHDRSRDPLPLSEAFLFLKAETPVIYFYTDRPQQVRVDVRFPRGLWTHWFPQAGLVRPQKPEPGASEPPSNGRIVWDADVLPPAPGLPEPPKAEADALWTFARDVDAAYVRTIDVTKPTQPEEFERFLFYRGLGNAPLPLRLSAADHGTLELGRAERHGMRHIFVVRIEGGKGAYFYLPALEPGGRAEGVIPSLAEAKPLEQFTHDLAEALAARLVESGLDPKEARAMVNTWRGSYVQTEGIRALFVLPREWSDEFIPMTISPQPKSVVRVMVGRLELLTPERYRRAEAAVRDLASPDTESRLRAFGDLREQGRYVEPIVRHLERTTRDDQVKTLCQRLLRTSFVTATRAAILDAANGNRLRDDPAQVQAQLATLLREIGLD